MLRRLAFSVLALCALLGFVSYAAIPEKMAPEPAQSDWHHAHTAATTVPARPALWRVQGRHGTIWLLGSMHLLPESVSWRSPEIARAIKTADVFVFEAPSDRAAMQKMQTLIATKGFLPPGQSLRAMLSPAARSDYDDELSALNIVPAAIDTRRPWLASLLMSVMQMKQETGRLRLGPDFQLALEAGVRRKAIRYLETIEQQMALIVPSDPDVELEEFEADLKEMRSEKDEFPAFIEAWSNGDVAKVDALMNGSFEGYPQARKVFLSDRNQAWLIQFEKMLDENHTFFVTVGAGHLAGPDGVPALLRAAGYGVEGP
jgi:hypothetical protein